ncbi:ATP-dependent nuclease [Haloferula sp.]|uniref:ATP-dependent nuclease n=1 Tax=Haloferula sp. TaxID=2497595 RepID=UPI00329AC3DE
MHITEIRIRNFRNFLKARFALRPGVNTLIGENGSGKTNAFQAIRFLLDENLSRNALSLKDSDFCRDLGQWRGEWIVISADFEALDPSDGCQMLRHTAAHMDESNSGTYTFVFRPKKEVRQKLYELSNGELQSYVESITIDDYEPLLTGRATGDFLDDEVYRQFAGNPQVGEYPDPDNDDQDKLGVRVGPIYQEVACTFVRALRDVVAELRGYRGNPLLTLLRGMESEIQLEDAEDIIQKVDELNDGISGLAEIQELATGIETALGKAVGITYGAGITIESAIPNSLEKILQRLSVLVGDQQTSSYRGEIQEQSLGGANLIYLALKLLEYELKLSSDRVAHFLLIEEPEAHIHTHIQKTLFANLPSDGTQVIVSTHSTHISSASRIASVNVLAKQDDHVEVYHPAEGLTPKTIARVERYMDAIRSTMLFAKGVLLVEGDAEQLLIPSLLNAIFGLSPDQLGFSVVSMNSAFFEHISVVFATERIRRPCAIITDRDAPLIDLPDDPDDDDVTQAHARAADLSGEARKEKLEAATADNPWLNAFYADHTFEVDFIAADNSHEVIEILPQIYRRQSNINTSKERLGSNEIGVSGKEILRLAEKKGKGWFALILAEVLTEQTYFPEYILRAIAFACHKSVTDSIFRQIGIYRMKKDDDLAPVLRGQEGYEELDPSEFVEQYCDEMPEDALALFRSFVTGFQDE